MKKIKYIYHWIMGLSINIICDFTIIVLGIFSAKVREDYIRRFYPDLLKDKEKLSRQIDH